jgi:hypothetical protein
MAVIPNAITTLAKVKTYLGITGTSDDVLLEMLIDNSSIYIENYCSRVFYKQEYEDIFNGDDFDDYVFIKNYPLIEVSKVEKLVDDVWVEIGETGYSVDLENGVIYFDVAIPSGVNNIKVYYEAGYTTIPLDLQLICMKMVAKLYNKRKSEGVSTEGLGQSSITWEDFLSKEIIDILTRYKNYKI